jgi:hypothetical protein
LICKNIKLSQDFKGLVSITLELTNKNDVKVLETLTDSVELYDVEVKKHREKRSMTSNRYLWVLLDKLANKLSSTKEEIYIEAVRKVGRFDYMPVIQNGVDRWIKDWKAKGTGWHSEIFRESTLKGYETTINYYGSSTYNQEEMCILINYVVDECKEQGIETMTTSEIDKLIEMMVKK